MRQFTRLHVSATNLKPLKYRIQSTIAASFFDYIDYIDYIEISPCVLQRVPV